jgi:hypothetical protein
MRRVPYSAFAVCRPRTLPVSSEPRAHWLLSGRREMSTGTETEIADSDITILEFPLEMAPPQQSHSGVEGAATYEDVNEIDSFAKAKVVNWINRRAKQSVTDAAVKIHTVRVGDHTTYRGSLLLNFGDDHGERTAEGLAENEKDAMLLTFMHAERCIDALGYQLYGLRSSQIRHVEAAKSKGRWAPSPTDTLKAPDTLCPPPLRCVQNEIRDRARSVVETKYHPVGDAPQGFAALPLTLASPDVVDASSIHRLRQLAKATGYRLEKLITAAPMSNNGGWQVHVSLPLPPKFGQRIGIGVASDRQTAVVIACMNAEVIVDAIGAELFPDSEEKQLRHSEECLRVGRWATAPREDHPDRWTSVSPAPFRYHPEAAAKARDSVTLSQLSARVTNIVTTTFVDREAPSHLAKYLGVHVDAIPYIQQRLGSTCRSSLLLPMPGPARVAVGIADEPDEADIAASMHALQILGALNIPVHKDPAAQSDFAASMRQHGGLAADPGSSEVADFASIATPPAVRIASDMDKKGRMKVSHTRAQKYAEEREIEALRGATSAPVRQSKESVLAELDAARAATPEALWRLTADDECIIIHPTSKASETRSMTHTLYSPRTLDPMARSRFVDYLERHGTPRSAAFVTGEVTSVETHTVYRATAVVPVPLDFGVRTARGEAPSVREAEFACSMHAELLLDTLGLPLYDHVVLQNRHAKAARSLGRYAPMAFDDPEPPSTPTPPPLRKDRADSLRWLRFVQRTRGKTATLGDVGQVDADAALLLDLIPLRQDEIDPLANIRVGKYLHRHAKSLANDVMTAQIGSSKAAVYRSRLSVPVPSGWRSPIAVGVASRRAESVILCCMHAERLIDQLRLHLFDDHSAQLQHHTIALLRGRVPAPPTPTEEPPTRQPEGCARIAGFQSVEGGPLPPPPTPPEGECPTDQWDAYVTRCQSFIRLHRQHESNPHSGVARAPRSGFPACDAFLDRIEAQPVDSNAQSQVMQVIHRLKHDTRSRVTSLRADVKPHRDGTHVVYVARLPHGFGPVTARGAAPRRHDAILRAFMHLRSMLERAFPDVAAIPNVAAVDATLPWSNRSVLRFHSKAYGHEEPQIRVRQVTENAFTAECNLTLADGRMVKGSAKRETAAEAEAASIAELLSVSKALASMQETCAFLAEHGRQLASEPYYVDDAGMDGAAVWKRILDEIRRLLKDPDPQARDDFMPHASDGRTRVQRCIDDVAAAAKKNSSDPSTAFMSLVEIAKSRAESLVETVGVLHERATLTSTLQTLAIECSASTLLQHLQEIERGCKGIGLACTVVCGSEIEAALIRVRLDTRTVATFECPENNSAGNGNATIVFCTTLDVDGLVGAGIVGSTAAKCGCIVLINPDESFDTLTAALQDSATGTTVVRCVVTNFTEEDPANADLVVHAVAEPSSARGRFQTAGARLVTITRSTGAGMLANQLLGAARVVLVTTPTIGQRVAAVFPRPVYFATHQAHHASARDAAACQAAALMTGSRLPAQTTVATVVVNAGIPLVNRWLDEPAPLRLSAAHHLVKVADASHSRGVSEIVLHAEAIYPLSQNVALAVGDGRSWVTHRRKELEETCRFLAALGQT